MEAFRAFYPQAIAKIDDYLRKIAVDFVREHCMKLLEYALKGGKGYRGYVCAAAFLETSGIDPSSKEAEIGYTLGWGLEILQAAYLVADDLMDGSKSRRGQECWYLRPGVGDQAVNDALILENMTFVLFDTLRGTISEDIVDAISSKVRFYNTLTTVGQAYDYKGDRHEFSCYDIVVENKTSYYTFVVPVIVGMLAAGKTDKEVMQKPLIDALLKIGYLFQAQDDYLDVYGDPEITGKVGTDIKDGKVTWLSCKAMELAGEDDKAALLSRDEAIVKAIYSKLNVPALFKEFEASEFAATKTMVEALTDCPTKAVLNLLGKLACRMS